MCCLFDKGSCFVLIRQGTAAIIFKKNDVAMTVCTLVFRNFVVSGGLGMMVRYGETVSVQAVFVSDGPDGAPPCRKDHITDKTDDNEKSFYDGDGLVCRFFRVGAEP